MAQFFCNDHFWDPQSLLSWKIQDLLGYSMLQMEEPVVW